MSFRRSRRDVLVGCAAAAWAACVAPAVSAATGSQRPFRLLADGLRFPEGPVALQDGSVVLVEIERRTLSRVPPGGGAPEIVARLGGGPNGAAIGPDGRCYVCNNGGSEFTTADGVLLPVGSAADYRGGSIQRVDLNQGTVETLYDSIEGQPLSAPNDLVFDAHGGFWFTDIGRSDANAREHGAILYARADGSDLRRVAYPLNAPNGIALSPDGHTLVVAELFTGRLIAFDVVAPGKLGNPGGLLPGRFLGAGPGRCLFDSIAAEADGHISVAAPLPGVVMRFRPDGSLLESIGMPGPLPTNIGFGGADRQTAFITLSGEGQLIAMDWPAPGLAPAHSA